MLRLLRRSVSMIFRLPRRPTELLPPSPHVSALPSARRWRCCCPLALFPLGSTLLTAHPLFHVRSTSLQMEVLLPMTVRFANPIQCGGSWGFVRYHGFFT